MASRETAPATHRRPTREGVHDGISYAVWMPQDGSPSVPAPGVVILHGAGSRKENHADFARLASGNGWAALAYDARGHGATGGAMSPAAVDDVGKMARLLASEQAVDPDRVIVRGSSMGGFFALRGAAASPSIAGAIAICPAGEEHLSRGLERGELEMRVDDVDALRAWLAEHDLREAVERIGAWPLIFLHAEGDEQIPYGWSQELDARAAGPHRLVLVPGGHHRTAQHDPELQAMALRWIERELDG